jgi:hypothetical protein
MALKLRNGRLYAYRSVRVGRKVETIYRGSGDLAVFCAILDEEASEERREATSDRRRRVAAETEARRSARIAGREFRDRLAAVDSAVAAYHRRARRLADGMLELWGFRRHARGQWRRRRMRITRITDLARPDHAELLRLVSSGDIPTLEAIVYSVDSELNRRSEAGTLNRGGIEELLADSLGDGFPRAEKEALIADAALIRLDLAPPGSPPAEVLMASRASVSWLEVRLLEFDRADLLNTQEPNYRKVEALDRMLSRASARLERSLLALGRLKRLKLPIVVNQVKVGSTACGWPGIERPRPWHLAGEAIGPEAERSIDRPIDAPAP